MTFKSPKPPTFALALVVVAGNLGAIIYGLELIAPSLGFTILYGVTVSAAIAWWIVADSRTSFVVDYGWFAFFTWPLFLPWYLIRTRRPLGCGFVVMGFASYFVSYSSAFFVASVVRGFFAR